MRRELREAGMLLDLVKNLSSLESAAEETVVRQGLLEGVTAVNRIVFGKENMPLLPVDIAAFGQNAFMRQLQAWIDYQVQELQIRKTISVQVDYDFRVFMQHVRYSTEQTLIEEAKACLEHLRAYSEHVYVQLIKRYNQFSEYWGSIDLDSGDFTLIEDRMHQLKAHWEQFLWLYDALADYRSKKVLYGILRCWLTFEFETKNRIRENNFCDYYDFDMFSCDEDEVFVDLGAYDGDSARSFIESFGNYKKIYCYEITPAMAQRVKENLSSYPDIIYRNVGVGAEKGVMYIDHAESEDSANRLRAQGGYEVEVVTLDDDIKEPVSFIKMDIEGAELEAIEGAKRHIKEEHPKMAVCTYHNNHHIWEVPRRLKELYPGYRLYMRYNGELNEFLISEFVTYAL